MVSEAQDWAFILVCKAFKVEKKEKKVDPPGSPLLVLTYVVAAVLSPLALSNMQLSALHLK